MKLTLSNTYTNSKDDSDENVGTGHEFDEEVSKHLKGDLLLVMKVRAAANYLNGQMRLPS